MKFTINGATTMPYSMTEDIQAASEAGFHYMEIWWDKLKDYLNFHTTDELKKLLTNAGIAPAGICPFLVSPFRDTEVLREEFCRALEAARDIACMTLTVCPDFRPMSMTRQEGMKKHAEEFAWYAGAAGEKGIRLAMEPIGCHTMVPGPAQAMELIRLAGSPPNLGIVMDTFHYARTGVTEEEIRDIPLERLYMVHVNDSEKGMAEELSDKDRLYPMEGCLDLARFRRLLEEKEYDGYCSVEVFRPGYWEEDIRKITGCALESVRQMFQK